MSVLTEYGNDDGEGSGKDRNGSSTSMTKTPKDPSTTVKPSLPTPALHDILAWQALVASGSWSGYQNEDILAAYDHYKALGAAHYGSPEYELGRALLHQLVRAYSARIHSKIPRNGPGHASESESARLTAAAIVRSAINDPSSPLGVKMRQHFRGVVQYASKTAARMQFGRADRSAWAKKQATQPGSSGPQSRFRSIEAMAERTAAGVDDDGIGAAIGTSQVLEGLGLVDDPRRRLDIQMGLSRAILEVTNPDLMLILLWTSMGYSAEDLAPVFNCTPPTIRNRLHAFGRSRHLAHLKK